MPQFKGSPLVYSLSSVSYSSTIRDQLRTGTIFIISGLHDLKAGGLEIKAQTHRIGDNVYFRVSNDERRRLLKTYLSQPRKYTPVLGATPTDAREALAILTHRLQASPQIEKLICF
jgi:hypothetical protein